MPESTLDKVYLCIIDFLEKEKISYLIIGGLAVGVIGEARVTQDIDLIIFINKSELKTFLNKASKKGFDFDEQKVLVDAEETGAIRLYYNDVWIDIILSSTELEESALARRKIIKLFKRRAYFPSPEDLILLKLIPGRKKDIMDAESIVIRHGKNLDRKYLEHWAQKICDEMEDMRVWKELQELLK